VYFSILFFLVAIQSWNCEFGLSNGWGFPFWVLYLFVQCNSWDFKFVICIGCFAGFYSWMSYWLWPIFSYWSIQFVKLQLDWIQLVVRTKQNQKKKRLFWFLIGYCNCKTVVFVLHLTLLLVIFVDDICGNNFIWID